MSIFTIRPSSVFPAILLGVALIAIGGCDRATRIDVVAPTGALTFDSPNDASEIQVRVRAQDLTDIPRPRITWSSSDPQIASVSEQGRVTPIRDGRAVIRVR